MTSKKHREYRNIQQWVINTDIGHIFTLNWERSDQWYFSFEIHFSFSFCKLHKQSFSFLYYHSFVHYNYVSFCKFASNHLYIYSIVLSHAIFVWISFMQSILNGNHLICLMWQSIGLTGSQTVPRTVITQYSLCSRLASRQNRRSRNSQHLAICFVAHAYF